MKIKTLVLGPLSTNTYLIEKDEKCLIVDPAYNFNTIKQEIGNLDLVAILITHYHFDHIGALEELKNYYNVPVIDYKTKVKVKSFDFTIIHNPGHTIDSVSFYFKKEKIMFVGDFIFKETIGRTDLETGNMNEMIESIKMIKKYDDDITLYPGHGEETTLGYEKLNNIYFKNWNSSFFIVSHILNKIDTQLFSIL